MQKLYLGAFALLLSAPIFGQTSFTTPSGYLTSEGGSYAYYFGRYADVRFQHADHEIKAMGLQTLSSVGYRLDARSHSSSTATGRTWTSVTLALSDCNFAALTSTFAANIIGSQTQVFSSATVSWPSQTGTGTTPMPWDANLAFPFNVTSTYIYTAVNDLLLDYTFLGGTMANNATWSGSTGYSYYLDGIPSTTSVAFGRNIYKTNPTCQDPAATGTGGAQSDIQVGLYHSTYSNPAWADKGVLQIFGYRTRPNALVVKAVCLKGLAPLGVGVNIGAQCNNFMIDMSPGSLILYVFTTANSNGDHSPWTYVPLAPLSFLKTLPSTTEFWLQGAWDYAGTSFALTSASRCKPDFNYPMAAPPDKKAIYSYNPTSATGSGPYNTNTYNPVTRYN